MLLYNGAFTFCICDVSAEAWPHNCDDGEKTALVHDTGLSQRVSATAHSTADDTLSPTTQANKEENTSA